MVDDAVAAELAAIWGEVCIGTVGRQLVTRIEIQGMGIHKGAVCLSIAFGCTIRGKGVLLRISS